MPSERSLMNLKPPWKPGETGNKKGRKLGLVTLLRQTLRRNTLNGVPTPDGRTVAEHLAERIVGHAMKGNAAYTAFILDRLLGKAGSGKDVSAAAGGDMRPIFEIVHNGRDPGLYGSDGSVAASSATERAAGA
jgi:hypothetical protein